MNQKILNLWKQNVAGNEIIYNAKVLKSNLCNFNDDYILAGCNIAIISGSVLFQVLVLYHPKILHHLLDVKQKLMEQQ